MKYKQIHIWHLSPNKVYIKLNKSFGKLFFEKLHNEFKTYRAIGDFLGVLRGDTIISTDWKVISRRIQIRKNNTNTFPNFWFINKNE